MVTLWLDIAAFSVSVVRTLGLGDFATLVHLDVVIVDPLSREVNTAMNHLHKASEVSPP